MGVCVCLNFKCLYFLDDWSNSKSFNKKIIFDSKIL